MFASKWHHPHYHFTSQSKVLTDETIFHPFKLCRPLYLSQFQARGKKVKESSKVSYPLKKQKMPSLYLNQIYSLLHCFRVALRVLASKDKNCIEQSALITSGHLLYEKKEGKESRG